MKTPSSIVVCFMGGCVLGTAGSPNHPYKVIPATNVFRLRSPPAKQAETPEQMPLPKITLQGITTILGRRQALFKVTLPARPPEPAKEIACVLSEGERVGEIEVLEINMPSSTVKFKNHGLEQSLTLQR
jgi:hypothetical protein